jgi:phenylalanyl-tRNA synthetase beta chain
LLDAARHNVFHNGPDVAIFESGTVYRSRGGEEAGTAGGGLPAHEHHGLAALLTGAIAPRTWRGPAPGADFFAVKALLEALLDRLSVSWFARAQQWPFLHPGRSAAVLLDDRARGDAEAAEDDPLLGFVGALHPLVAAAWDLESASVFALDLGRVAQAAPRVVAYRELAAVPPLRQDLAVAAPEDVSAQQIMQAVRAGAGELLEDVEVFDVYAGEQVGEGRRSLALALSFRAPDRTLTDADVAPARERILAALAKLGGELRG